VSCAGLLKNAPPLFFTCGKEGGMSFSSYFQD